MRTCGAQEARCSPDALIIALASPMKPCMYHPHALPVCVLHSAHLGTRLSSMVTAVQAQYPLSQLSCGLSMPTAPI